ncbi:MAG: metal ABC transporter ATP-binding protein [Armatimonadota bacterium]
MNELICAHNLGYHYSQPSTTALAGVDFGVDSGQFVAIMGPNGSGKTTLVKLLLGLLVPTQGTVTVAGKQPRDARLEVQQLIGYVPQHESVNAQIPVNVRDVVGMAAQCRYDGALDRKEVRRRVQAALDMVELGDLAGRPYGALSGGQQQRALIARALVVDPQIIIADEPFARVDALSHQNIVNLLKWLSDEKQVTVLVVVHDVNPLVHILNKVLLLNTEMVLYGAPTEVLTSANLLQAYGKVVPILVCDEGFLHPLTEGQHD